MYNNEYDDDFDSDENEPQEQNPSDIKSLRKAASGKKQLEQELANARRELAFMKAGINPEDPKMRYFVKGYDGDLSGEAVRQAALEAGFLTSRAPDPALQQTAAAQERVMQASAGGVVEDASEAAAFARLEQAMEEGGIEAMLDVARQYGIPIQSEM